MTRNGLWATVAMSSLMATAIAGVSLGAGALAQADLRALSQQNQIRQQQDIARRDALAAQQQASAAQSRYETQLTLRSLDAARGPRPAAPTLRPAQPVAPPRGADPADIAADAERMDRLTDERLAESNARLREITPAH
jgi:hypothetical protein